MGIVDFIKKKREEEKYKKHENDIYRRRIIMEMELRGEKPKLKKMPEEIELDGYMEEDKRDMIRELVQKERAKRSMFGNFRQKSNIKRPYKKIKPNSYNLKGNGWLKK